MLHRAIAWSAWATEPSGCWAASAPGRLIGMVASPRRWLRSHSLRLRGRHVVYGLRLWRSAAVAAALAVCVTTGGMTVYNVIFSNEPAPELIEVPLMTMMVLATIWHVRSRQKAAAVVAAVADERQRMIERERTFFANVTHDLMTPITVARGHVDILGRTGPPTPDELAETKHVIIEELRRIESMVGDLLLVGRLDQDAGLQKAKLDVEDFLHVVADRWKAVAERTFTIDVDAPGAILADGNTLSQALDNVIENAVSYTEPGDAITLRARAEWQPCDRSGRYGPRHPPTPSPTSSIGSTGPIAAAPVPPAGPASGSRSYATSSRPTAARCRSSRRPRAARG